MSGRPPFGLGPIARVSSPPSYGGSTPPESIAAGGPSRPPERGFAPGGGVGTSGGVGTGGGVGVGIGGRFDPARTRAFGLPNLRRNVCPHFYVTGTRGALPIHAPHLLKGIVRQDSVISRCQLRGGVHLEQSYVNDVCLSPRFNQCVFYEEELSGR